MTYNKKSIRICLIQNNIAPYRIPLFEYISQPPEIDFTLLLMASEKPSYPQWNRYLKKLPFKSEIISGLRIKLRSGSQICINPSLLSTLMKYKPDVVFCCGFTFSTFLVLLYKALWGKPFVIWSEGHAISEDYRGFKVIRRLIRIVMARFADAFVDVGVLSKQYIESLLPENHSKPFYRSYNSIDSKRFLHEIKAFKQDKPSYLRFRHRFPDKNILYSGRLVEIKGIHQLIRAYRKVLEKSSEPVGLIVLGQGELRSYLEREKENSKMDFLFIEGFINEPDYQKYFSIADLFLLLSWYDCNPLVVFEALVSGLPIVCSERVGNAHDFILNGENGYIVDPFNTEDVANKVVNLINSSSLNKIGKVSMEMAKRVNYRNSAYAFIDAAKTLTKFNL